jgi:DNA polymerase-3 subunit alpha
MEYMCSLLTSVMDDEDKLKSYSSETKRMGIMIKAPNINESQTNYAIHDKVLKDGRKLSYLVTPFMAIKGVGEKAVYSIVQNQPYNSFRNFLEKVDSSKVNSKVVTCLIDAGCMDDMWGMARPEMKKEYETLKKEVAKFKKKLQKNKDDAILDEEFMENLDGGIFE